MSEVNMSEVIMSEVQMSEVIMSEAVAYLLGGQGGQAAPLTSHKQKKKKKITMDKK